MAKKKETVATSTLRVDPFARVNESMKELNKHYGRNLIKRGADMSEVYKVPYNEPMIDYVSDGGVIVGRMNEALGDNHSGKTRNALRSMGKFQKYCFNCHSANSLTAIWELTKDGSPSLVSAECSKCTEAKTNVQVMVDIEGTTDPKFMKNFDIDINGVIYVRPDMPSQAVGIIDAFLRMPEIGLILMDSIGSMGGDKEVETAIENDKMNQNALFFNKAIRKWQMALNSNTNETGMENGTTMIIINQSYVTLSIYSSEVAQGGRGLRHGKAMSQKTRIKEKVLDPVTKEVVGVHIEVKNEKNKAGVPYRRGEYYLNLDKRNTDIGYCQTNVDLQYIELAIMIGAIEQKGGWYYYKDEKWQGKATLIEALNDDIRAEVDEMLYNG